MNLVRLCMISLFKGLNRKEFNNQFAILPVSIQKQLHGLVKCLDEKNMRIACEKDYLVAVKYFVKDCKMDIRVENDKALRYAVHYNRLNVVKFLIESGANIHALKDLALRLAAERGHLDVIKYLVEKGYYESINKKN